MSKKAIVGIIMGSDSDLPVMESALEILKYFNIPFEVKILSAHRTPNQHANYAESAERRGLKVIIAAAGGAAHLPGVTAAQTTLPIIGVPIKSRALSGLDSLLSIVQMPPGVPVATVSINGAKNAAILAVQILAQSDKSLKQKIKRYKGKMERESMAKNNKINN